MQEALQAAQDLASQSNHQEITNEHFLLSLLNQSDGIAQPLLEKIGVQPTQLRDNLLAELNRKPRVTGAVDLRMSNELRTVLDASEKEMAKLKDEYTSAEHYLLALSGSNVPAAKILKDLGVTHNKLMQALQQVRGSQRVTDQNPEGKYQTLEKYGRDLTELARRGKIDPVIGRDNEIRRIMQVISRRTKNNPVLIGDPGVGKTAIVEGLARRIISGDVPESLKQKKIIAKDAALERRFQPVMVDEPSVEDTIAILRGLKERYEVHHGVRIQDAALVASSTLSHRYISDRFLPDKAIDLLDEAASRLKIEIDSMPFEIDVVERRIRQLEIERAALAKETDDASKQRLAALESELQSLQEERDGMVAHWQLE